MKDKNTAATLAFFGGFLGLHKFYLEEQGAGIFYVFLTAVTVRIFAMPLAVLLGVIDCMVLLSMSEEDFDTKYNQKGNTSSRSNNRRQERQRRAGPNNRYERYQERERQRRRGGQDQTSSRRRKKSARNQRDAPVVPSQASRSSRRATARRTLNPKLKAELEEGIRYFKDYEFDRAIESFEEVLQLDPSNVAAHFNLGCAYSAEEKRDKAFYHLDRAVALGFNDFDRIRTHDSLAFLRIQDRFQEFADNGFRLVQDIPSPGKVAGDSIAAETTNEDVPSSPTGDLLEQLSQLAELREKGLLTEAEFDSQKKRLLG